MAMKKVDVPFEIQITDKCLDIETGNTNVVFTGIYNGKPLGRIDVTVFGEPTEAKLEELSKNAIEIVIRQAIDFFDKCSHPYQSID